MAITRVNVGTLVRADSGNVTPTNPASIVAGDILVLISGAADNVVETLPAGWVKKIEQNAGTNCRLTVAWIRYDGVAGNPLVTHAAGSSVWAVIVAYRGCKSSGDPFTDAQAQPNLGITTTDTAPTITPLNGDQVIFAAAMGEGGTNNGSGQTLSGWSGANPTLTERADNNDPGTGTLLCDGGFADGPSTGGATGSRTVTMGLTGQATTNGVGALLALTQDLAAGGSQPSAMLPLTGLAIPGQPTVAPPIGPTRGSDEDPNARDVVTPLPISQFVHPLSLVMATRLFPAPQPYVIPIAGTVFNDSGSGTITLSGSGTESQSHSSSATGTITLSGTKTESQSHSSSGTGTITLSGTGTESASHARSAAGTVTLTGAFTEAQSHSSSGAGTVTLNGSGTENFQPPGGGGGPTVFDDDRTAKILLVTTGR